MFSIEEVHNQAYNDSNAAKLQGWGYQSVSLRDVKIVKDDIYHTIEIFNTSKRYYVPISNSSMEVFKEYGWRYGTLYITLSNVRLKLDIVETSIRDEVNSKKTEKTIKQLKSKREDLMTEYTQLNNKLNDSKKNRDNI